jgi:hypothetical protein
MPLLRLPTNKFDRQSTSIEDASRRQPSDLEQIIPPLACLLTGN